MSELLDCQYAFRMSVKLNMRNDWDDRIMNRKYLIRPVVCFTS